MDISDADTTVTRFVYIYIYYILYIIHIYNRSVDFSDADATVTRSVRGNPKASVFALWSTAGGGRAGKLEGVTQDEGGGAEGGGLAGVGAGATWAVRVNECQGGSLHIGCITNAYKVLNLLVLPVQKYKY